VPDWVILVAAFSATLTAAGLIGSSWGRVAGLRADLEDARRRDADHVADLAESRSDTAKALEDSVEKSRHIALLQASLTGKVEWTQVVAALAAHDQLSKTEHARILTLLNEIKTLLDEDE
jgi:hypothetical protein